MIYVFLMTCLGVTVLTVVIANRFHRWLMTRYMEELETPEEQQAWLRVCLLTEQMERERHKTPYTSIKEYQEDSSTGRKLRTPLTDWAKVK